MKIKGCQILYLESISQGTLKYPPLSLFSRLKLELRKRLSPSAFRSLKKNIDLIISKIKPQSYSDYSTTQQTHKFELKPGTRVRVRCREEIEVLLDRWKETKNCGFMDGMWEYCNTIQVIKKSIHRFVDERTLEVKKTNGIVILENVFCNGTLIFGECDRSCYFFWKEEWLEKL